jgi:hypothetical protein
LSTIGHVVALGYVATPAKQLNIRPDVQAAFGYWQDVVDVGLIGPVVTLRLYAQGIAIAATLLVSLHNLYYIDHVTNALCSLDMIPVSLCLSSLGFCFICLSVGPYAASNRAILFLCVLINPNGIAALNTSDITRGLLVSWLQCLSSFLFTSL